MARRIIHYYSGDIHAAQYVTDTILCGGSYAWKSRVSNEPSQVTCVRCQAGLRKRGLLPRIPRPAQGPTNFTTEQARSAVEDVVRARTGQRQAPPDPDNVDDYNNTLLRLGII